MLYKTYQLAINCLMSGILVLMVTATIVAAATQGMPLGVQPLSTAAEALHEEAPTSSYQEPTTRQATGSCYFSSVILGVICMK